MTEEAPKKKRGCLFWILAVVGGIIVINILVMALYFATTTPEEREALAEQSAQERIEREAERESEKEAEAQAIVESTTSVTANELWAAFSQNEVAAQRAYGDRSLLITGTVDSIQLDMFDEPVVSLRTGNQFQSVQLDFDEGDADAVSQLRVGQEVSALCNELSEVIGTPMLDDCTLN